MKKPKVYIKRLDRVFEVESIRFDTKVVEIYDEEASIYHYCDFDFDEVELIEDTGLKDKNGTSIFVGDIVKTEIRNKVYLKVVGKSDICNAVVFKNENYSSLFFVSDEKNVEVIGNIYENKDLLEW